MMTDMVWLPPPPADFRERLATLRRQLAECPTDLGEQVVRLATAAFDENQLRKLARLATEIVQQGHPIAHLSKVKIGLVGDGTLSLSTPAIIGSGLRHGLLIDVVEGGYNSAVQEALDPSSALHAAKPNMAIVVGDARLLGLERAASTKDAANSLVDAALQRLKLIVNRLRPSIASSIFVQTIPAPIEPLFGSYDRLEPGSPFAMVEALNFKLAKWAAGGDICLIDVARLAASVGLEQWHDPPHWHAAKLSFAPQMIPLYADVVARTIAASLGKSRKCLVLDLDNTLWGGVIGDDGLNGIVLGQGSATGEAFLAIQQYALELRARGIVLAVSSKNEDKTARLPFRQHPDMLLREDHIAVFQANWTDKAANLRAIAETLNIGVDALAFLDDNPAERMQVREQMPLVAVPELPDDPAFFPRALAAAGYFEAVSISSEDRQRADYYQANAQRAASLSASGDLETHLRSLEMVCAIREVDAQSRTRVSQLINKSNQFNLTTRRYSEVEVAAVEADPSRHIIQVRLADRFGDNGIISVVIANRHEDQWDIDTWLMSCRVLGRRVEEAVLNHLVEAAARENVRQIAGRYIPSPKNAMVVDHYRNLGFECSASTPDGKTVWRLDVTTFRAPELPMVIDDIYLKAQARAA